MYKLFIPINLVKVHNAVINYLMKRRSKVYSLSLDKHYNNSF